MARDKQYRPAQHHLAVSMAHTIASRLCAVSPARGFPQWEVTMFRQALWRIETILAELLCDFGEYAMRRKS
jgi:hypothetical protein